MKTLTSLLPVLCIMVMAAGCTQPPSEQITAAEQAVKDAEQSGAGTYLPEDFAKVEGILAAMKKEVADQDGKFSLLRDYGRAEQLAADAKAEAERVKTESMKKMEEAKFAATQAHQTAQNTIKSTLELVARAPAGKDRAALESIKTDVETLKASLNDVQMMIDRSDYLEAQTKAKAIQEKGQAISQEIESALAKIGKGKTAPGSKKK